MAGLISDADKAALHAEFNSAMASFFVPIVIYTAPQKTVVTEDLNYNPFDSADQNNLDPVNTPIRHVVSGRIQFGQKQGNPFAYPDTTKVRVAEGQVRIKVDSSGAFVLSNAKEIEINGMRFDIDSTARPHGIFSGTYASFLFKRVI